MEDKEIKKIVREGYAEIAKKGSCCCSSSPASSCCGAITPETLSKQIGYTEEDIKAVPEEAVLGLGCGNPVALASLKEGDTVLDLGSGGGFDCFLSTAKVGKSGKVIGVDMTPEMIESARENAEKGNYQNVEFRLGEIEDLPEAVMDSMDAYVGCISGSIKKEDYLNLIRDAGFDDIKVIDQTGFPAEIISSIISGEDMDKLIEDLGMTVEEIGEMGNSVVSIKVEGIKRA